MARRMPEWKVEITTTRKLTSECEVPPARCLKQLLVTMSYWRLLVAGMRPAAIALAGGRSREACLQASVPAAAAACRSV